jgi:uncharacterized protein
MNQAERYQKIAEFVQTRLEKMAVENPAEWHDPVYRWEHTLRVAHYGGQIARAEGAHTEVVEAACLLHDVAHFDLMEDYKDHGREGARLSRPLLEGLGYTSEQVESICYAIAVHVDGKADFDHEHTIEANIVSDADNIDRFGAFRILQWCEPLMGDHRALVENLEQRVEHLQGYIENNPLETPTGQQLFADQLRRQVVFFKDLIEEYSLNKMPGS